MSGKQAVFCLHVEAGSDQGRRFAIPPGGARLGRSSGNDIVLTDPSLSRFHCRLFFKPDGTLWISDLGSTNASLVNNQPIPDAPLKPGDVLEFGSTRLRIQSEEPAPAPAPEPAPTRVDLGLGSPSEAPPRDEPSSKSRPSLVLLVVILALAVTGIVYWMKPPANGRKAGDQTPRSLPAALGARSDAFEFSYEKEEGSTNNLFRYVLSLQDNTLSVQIDDAATRRHVVREKKLAPEVVGGLASDLNRLAFFELKGDYSGVPREGEWAARDLSLTLGNRSHKVRVANRLDPDELKPVLETLETFAQNELSLTSLTYTPERLLEMAQEAYQLGQKFLDERDVRPDNLFNAIRTFESCQWYLETVEPKPPFFLAAATAADQARQSLDTEYNARLFEAEKAWSLSDWSRAAEQYRQILALIPDRSDDRHQNALKKQLDVERRIRR